MKSKKQLFEVLEKIIGQEFDLRTGGVSDETYGKKSFIYLWDVKDNFGVEREKLELALEAEGFKVMRDYYPGSQTLEIQVSYFKGWHWDE
jgi:hypothetical protein